MISQEILSAIHVQFAGIFSEQFHLLTFLVPQFHFLPFVLQRKTPDPTQHSEQGGNFLFLVLMHEGLGHSTFNRDVSSTFYVCACLCALFPLIYSHLHNVVSCPSQGEPPHNMLCLILHRMDQYTLQEGDTSPANNCSMQDTTYYRGVKFFSFVQCMF